MSINQENSFKPSLSLVDATMIVAGSMIGSGIFIVSAEVARSMGSSGWMMAMWVLAGVVTLIAALSYGELSGMFPKAGGQYVYLREAYNPFIAFLFGWTQFGVIQTGTIAAVAMAFAKYVGYLAPGLGETNYLLEVGGFHLSAAQLVAMASIILLTFINTKGVKNGKIIQTVFTFTKLFSLFGLIIFGLIIGAKAEIWNANWENAWQLSNLSMENGQLVTTGLTTMAFFGAMAVSMKGTLFSSDAWNNVTFIAGEIKNPQKNIGRALLLGTLIVTIIYVATNVMYLAVLPFNDIAFAPSDRVGVAAAESIFGAGVGAVTIAVMIIISTFGCNNGLILSGARIYYTMAKDGLFFKQAGELNKDDVPGFGLWIQCAWTCLLCLSGKYNDLLAMVIFGVLVFYVITILGIFILRKTRPDVPRSYKAFGYPVLPALYILIAFSLAVLLLIYEPNYAIPGLGIILLGIPLYFIALRSKK
ncbi:amino acid permease [Chitinophaga sp. SYP-B3965]|uniref:APC family permease n=1 Tax=Chitinophaga sp. SYP-B3965 TaxID=2663120 RepID=UPI00129A0517|nr:amino acid permease [Chitinophaga sp. SYP-B3965]MRG46143.1 amino acid permease [Chitinophaga sp. SYP-B3965]